MAIFWVDYQPESQPDGFEVPWHAIGIGLTSVPTQQIIAGSAKPVASSSYNWRRNPVDDWTSA